MKKKNRKHLRTSHHRAFIESCILVFLSFFIAFLLYQSGLIHSLINSLHSFGYIGAFLAGIFFVSVFTAAPATIVILMLAESLPIVPLAIAAGVGTVVGDSIIFALLSHRIEQTLAIFPKETGVRRIITVLRHTKHRFLLTILGAFVIASPLPDELGLALMGVSKVHPITTAAITFILNTLGIFFLLVVLK